MNLKFFTYMHLINYIFCLLPRDVAAVIDAIARDDPIILVGHSMGGAVAVRAAALIPNLYGLGVIDVVEGTAMDALASMQSFLRSRPSSFSTISQAIEWWLVFFMVFINISVIIF